MRRRPIALAMLMWFVPACTAWHVEQGVTPQQLIADRHPGAVRVTLPDRSQIVLDQPRITGDSVAGIVDGRDSSVAASNVTQVAVRKVSSGRTAGLVVGFADPRAYIATSPAMPPGQL